MKRLGFALLVTVVVALGSASESSALSFTLNCIIGNSGCTPSATYGTVTLTDNGDSVDLTVSLLGGQKILAVYLNYADSQFSNSSAFELASKDVGVDENNNPLPPYNSGKFDLKIPTTGNVNEFGIYSDTFSLSSFNLSPADFDFKDSSGLLFAAVHIGNCSAAPGSTSACDPGLTGEGSIKVGALDPPVATPEPATLVLWGTTMAGMGWVARRRRKRS
jgi:hypothetical protein